MFGTVYKNNYSMLMVGLVIGGIAGCCLGKHTHMFKDIMHGHKCESMGAKAGDSINQNISKTVNNMDKDEKKKNFENFMNTSEKDIKKSIDDMNLSDA